MRFADAGDVHGEVVAAFRERDNVLGRAATVDWQIVCLGHDGFSFGVNAKDCTKFWRVRQRAAYEEPPVRQLARNRPCGSWFIHKVFKSLEPPAPTGILRKSNMGKQGVKNEGET